jgi:hypothetical protein
MLRLIPVESSPMTIIRRILLGETVGIQVVEVVSLPLELVVVTDNDLV